MATVTISHYHYMAWICHGCGAMFPCDGPEDDPHGAQHAATHEQQCGHDVRIGISHPEFKAEIEPPSPLAAS